MFNPFVAFSEKMIESFRKDGKRWLVSQTFRGWLKNADDKVVLLMSDYDSREKARIHYNAILDDQYKFILDLENEKHRNKLIEMLAPYSKYIVFAAFISDQRSVNARLNKKYANSIRNYLSQKTNWRIKASEGISPKLQLIYGELLVAIRFYSQEVRIKLSELEKY